MIWQTPITHRKKRYNFCFCKILLFFFRVWKKIYPIITGIKSNVSTDVVDNLLKLYKQQIIENLLKFKPYTKESFKTWKKESGLKELVADDEMCNFIHLLSKEIVSKQEVRNLLTTTLYLTQL